MLTGALRTGETIGRDKHPAAMEAGLGSAGVLRKFLFGEMTWVEVRDLDKDRVVLVPVGTLEDHGLHLPIDTDVRLAGEVCRLAAEKAPDEVVLIPPVVYGYSPHHMDFPGTVTVYWSTFVEYLLDVCRSLARHGFRRILIVNGHGSNQNLVEMVARLTVVEFPGVLCAAMFYLTGPKGRAAIEKVRESEFPGGVLRMLVSWRRRCILLFGRSLWIWGGL